MTKGSLVLFEDPNDPRLWIAGVVLKGPYGTVLHLEESAYVEEIQAVDVLFGTQVIKKIPISKLKVVK